MFLKCKITINSYTDKFFDRAFFYNRKFSSPFYFLIFLHFKLNRDRYKLDLELKLLQQNQSKRLSIVVSRSDINYKDMYQQLYEVVSSAWFEISDV